MDDTPTSPDGGGSAVPKIAGQQLYFFEVFFHGFSFIETDTAGEEDSP